MKLLSMTSVLALVLVGCAAATDSESAPNASSAQPAVGSAQQPMVASDSDMLGCYYCTTICADGSRDTGWGWTVDEAYQSLDCNGSGFGSGSIDCYHYSCIFDF